MTQLATEQESRLHQGTVARKGLRLVEWRKDDGLAIGDHA